MRLTLSVTELSIERGGRPLVTGLSFAVAGGEVLEVVGPNGVGKSSLLRVLAGLLPAAGGTVRLDPPGAEDPDAPVAERMHYVGHADAVKPALSAGENLRFAQALAAGRGASVTEALARFGLAHAADLPCAYLSAGQRRRLALARLLVAARPLWLLDEPATALDRGSEAVLTAVARDHLATGGLIVAATHASLRLPGMRELRLGAA